MNPDTNADVTSHSTVRRPIKALAAVRDDLLERRQARLQHRVLVRELATYTTRSEVDDLLAVFDHEETADAEEIRSILTRNLQNNQTRRPLAS